jgi:hypothetical protein
MKRIEWFEINANDSENSCWIVISDKVYDVTNFIHNHVLFFILVKSNKLLARGRLSYFIICWLRCDYCI